MARVTIVIEDLPSGKVSTVCTPTAEVLLAECAKKEGRGVAPSKLYALRALTAILKLGREPGGIITRLPKLGS